MRISPGSKLGSYEVLALLGAGGMGEVYRARDTRLGREVAIKVLPAERMADENRRRRFVQEARAASALNHPNIVTIYEIESADGIDFIVMEYVPGKTLDALSRRTGCGSARSCASPSRSRTRWRRPRPGHRPPRPEARERGGEPRGCRQGSRLRPGEAGVGEETSDDQQTMTRETAASSAEPSGGGRGDGGLHVPRAGDGGKVDSRSDVFSFGAVLYEMVTGRRAFAGSSTAETLAAVVRDQPKAPSEVVADVPRELEQADPALPAEGARPALPAHGGREGRARARSRRNRTHSPRRRPCRPGATSAVARGRARGGAGSGHDGLDPLAVTGAEVPQPTAAPLTFMPGGKWAPTFSPGRRASWRSPGKVRRGQLGIY